MHICWTFIASFLLHYGRLVSLAPPAVEWAGCRFLYHCEDFFFLVGIVTNPNSVHLPGLAVSLHGHHLVAVFRYLDWLAFSWQQVSCVRVIGKSVSHMNGCIKWDLSFLWLDEQGWWRACHGWSVELFHLIIVSYCQQLRLVTELLGLKSQLLEYLGWLFPPNFWHL